jgi:hypothetical protein
MMLLAGLFAIAVGACKTEVKDAQWYLDHSDQLSQKLESCKVDPEASKTDAECAAATEAFLRWYAASGQGAQQPTTDASGVDARLAPPAADAATADPILTPSNGTEGQPQDGTPPAAADGTVQDPAVPPSEQKQ